MNHSYGTALVFECAKETLGPCDSGFPLAGTATMPLSNERKTKPVERIFVIGKEI